MPRPETIFALATPAHPSPVALLRVSGPLVETIARELCGAELRRASIECRITLPVGAVPASAWLLPAPHTRPSWSTATPSTQFPPPPPSAVHFFCGTL